MATETAMSLGGQPLLSPTDVARECERHGFSSASFVGRANSYSVGHGTKPGPAWLLMRLGDFVMLDRNEPQTLMMHSGGTTLEFDNLYIQRATCVIPGREDEPDAPYLVYAEDIRCLLRMFSVPRTHFNIRSHGSNTSAGTMWTGPDGIYTIDYGEKKFYSNTGGTDSINDIFRSVVDLVPESIMGTGSVASWNSIGPPPPLFMGQPGDYQIPENIVLPDNVADALQYLLDLTGQKLVYLPGATGSGTSLRFRIDPNYALDAISDPSVSPAYGSPGVFNSYEEIPGPRVRYPETIAVQFRRCREGWGLDYDTQVELTQPYYTVVADTAAIWSDLGIATEDLEPESIVTLEGFGTLADFDELDVLQNEPALQRDADWIAKVYLKQIGATTTRPRFREVYPYLIGPSVAPFAGPVWYGGITRQTWGDTGNGPTTEYYHENKPTIGLTKQERIDGPRFLVDRKIVRIDGQTNVRKGIYGATVFAPDAYAEVAGGQVTLSPTGETLVVGNFRDNKLVPGHFYMAYKFYVRNGERTFRWLVDNQATFI